MGSKGVMVSGDEFSRNVPRKKPSFSERTRAFLADQEAIKTKGREIRRQQGGGQAAPPLSLSSDIDISLLVDIANLLKLDGDSQSFLEKVTYATTDAEREANKASLANRHRKALESRGNVVPEGYGEDPPETSLATTDPDSTKGIGRDLSEFSTPGSNRWPGMADDEPESTTSEPESTTEADDTSSTKPPVDPNFDEEKWMRETLSIGDDDTPSESVEPAAPSKPADTTPETTDTPAKTGRMRAAGKKAGTGVRDFGTGFGEGFSGGRSDSSGGVNINIGGGTAGTTAGGAGTTPASADSTKDDDASAAASAAATGDYKGEPTTPPKPTYTQTKIPPPVTPTPTKTIPSPTTAAKPTKPPTALGSGSSPTASPTAAIPPTKPQTALGPGKPPTPPTSSSIDKPTGTSTLDEPIGKSWNYSG